MSPLARRGDRGAKGSGGSQPAILLWLQLLVALVWTFVVFGLCFQKGSGKPRRPNQEPADWKLVLWMVAFIASLPAIALAPVLIRHL